MIKRKKTVLMPETIFKSDPKSLATSTIKKYRRELYEYYRCLIEHCFDSIGEDDQALLVRMYESKLVEFDAQISLRAINEKLTSIAGKAQAL